MNKKHNTNDHPIRMNIDVNYSYHENECYSGDSIVTLIKSIKYDNDELD